MSYPRESRLEKFIKDFVRKRTAEKVDLRLQENCISVAEIRGKKNILLAKFWANIFQHENNYPVSTHRYKKNVDDDLLRVKVDTTEVNIDMKSGELSLKGEFIYDWFDKNFWQLIEVCDADFAKSWKYEPSPVIRKIAPTSDDRQLNDQITDIEKYQLGVAHHGQLVAPSFEEKIQSLILPDFRELYVDMVFWSKSTIDRELEYLRNKGSLKSGFSYVYPLWRSLLHRWLQEEDARVTITTPAMDTDRLCDLARLILMSQPKQNLAWIYVDKTESQAEVLGEFPLVVKAHLEYFMFNRIVIPAQRNNCSFIARVKNGEAHIIVTSARFHADSFGCHSNESVVYLQLSESEFNQRYLQPNERH